MKTQTSLIGAAVIILVLGSIGYAFYASQNSISALKPHVAIINFEQCVAAGNTVMESYPRQCKTGDQNFTEQIATPEAVATQPVGGVPAPQQATTSSSVESMITVTSPLPNTKIKSPLEITGSARGGWYFEASFPVILIDAKGKTIAQSPAEAKGEWMTTEFVPYSVTLTWSKNTATSGTLIFKRDNPSELPENDKEMRIPVTF